jgi:Arc/MetJ-type ribon-helix-helix transcriptional regulator
MMARTQITLSPQEHRRARAKAAELGISLAEYIRRLVREDLGEQKRRTDLSAIVGLGNSGGSDIARFKDEYIGEAVEAEWKRETGRS